MQGLVVALQRGQVKSGKSGVVVDEGDLMDSLIAMDRFMVASLKAQTDATWKDVVSWLMGKLRC